MTRRTRTGVAPLSARSAAAVPGDIRYALRALRRAPGYTAVVVLTLALGIGAVAAAQGVIDPLLLRSLRFQDAERLVTLDSGLLPGEYSIIQEQVASFERLSLYLPGRALGLAGDGESERVTTAIVTPEFFATLGVRPLIGRVPDERGAEAGEAVLLSWGLWQRRYGAAPGIVGRVVRLDGRAMSVAGVMPSGFSYPERTHLWLVRPVNRADPASHWGVGGYRLVGRLRAGVSPVRAESEIRALSAVLSAANPFWTPAADYRSGVRVLSLHEAEVGEVRRALLLLGAAVTLLLLLARANVANLVLARGFGRARELAVRTALGASPGRVVRQLLTETVVLGGAGGAAGIALAFGAVAVLKRMLPPDMPRVAEIGIDARVLAGSVIVTLATGLLLGVLPARRATRYHVQTSLRGGGHVTGDGRSRRLSGGLVVAQVALAVLLVAGAGLLVRSLVALERIDTGLARIEVMTARVDLPSAQYGSAAQRNVFYDQLLARVAALPGVRHAAATSQLPFSGHFQGSAMAVEHVTTDPNDLPVLIHRRITPLALQALGIPLLRGRAFDERDGAGGMPVALVDETAARTFWPGQDPIGRRLGRPWLKEQLVVVGVVAAVLDGELAGVPEPTVYTPLAQEPPHSAFLVIGGTNGDVLPALRAALRAVDPAVPLSEIASVRSLIGATLSGQRLATRLLAAFGGLALVLAAVGTYGVLAHSVGQRDREIAVRIALGARARDVLLLVFADGMKLVASGAALGIAAAFLLMRVLAGMLYGVATTEPVTLLLVTAVVLATAAAAVLIPARRASSVAPIQALRD